MIRPDANLSIPFTNGLGPKAGHPDGVNLLTFIKLAPSERELGSIGAIQS